MPLSRQAVTVLRELRGMAGNSPFVFPSPSKDGCMSNNTMLFALYRMGYHGRATTHGFRRVALIWRRSSARENEFQLLAAALRRIMRELIPDLGAIEPTSQQECEAEPA